MIRSTILKKSVVIFLITLMLTNVLAPTIAWSLTAGPSAPEFTSFEPVDTTDFVNLATGELVYNNPILEIPGPNGGYPISLSYHAGIKVDQEASWVGLGWTLNPGAINRTINGFPDDAIESKRKVIDYWGGGTQKTKTYSLGINIPSTGIGLNYTLAKTQDTFKGFSSKGYAGVNVNPLSTILNVGLGNFGKINQAIKNSSYPQDLKSYISGMGFRSLNNNVSVDFSISSNGIKTTSTVAGYTFGQKNNSAGAISQNTTSKDIFTLPIGSYGSFGIKQFLTRYWSDQANSLFTTGSLYPSKLIKTDGYQMTDQSGSEFLSYAFDTYDIYDNSSIDSKDEADPYKQIGGTLPAYDRYDVMAQGLGGAMQPFIFENGDLKGQNSYLRDDFAGNPSVAHPKVKYNSIRTFGSNRQTDFRFLNDFSNSLSINPSSISFDGTNFSVNEHGIISNSEGFEYTPNRQKLEGSKSIEWYTTAQIISGYAASRDFIDYYQVKTDRPTTKVTYENYLQPEAGLPYSLPFSYGLGEGSFTKDNYADSDPYQDILVRNFRSLKSINNDLTNKIGGFKITNESGVTYHYALPVYTFNEYTRNKLKNPKKGVSTFTEYKSNEPYAYTWLLTAITGPDYIDRGDTNGAGNGVLDESDFGYWVKFDYGKWTDNYQWRTPHTGYMTDVESEYESFSYGVKELYYLDQIETKTHKALFIKSKRKDGRGVTSRLEGGSKPRSYKMHFKQSADLGDLNFSVSPVSVLKLDAIYLFDKNNLSGVNINKAAGTKYEYMSTEHSFPYIGSSYNYAVPYTSTTVTIAQGSDFVKTIYHNDDLVLDDSDLDLLILKQRASRIVEFSTDYSLAKETPNSIGYFGDSNSYWNGLDFCNGQPDNNMDFEWPINLNSSCMSPGYNGAPTACLSADKELFYSDNPVERFYGYNLPPPCLSIGNEYLGQDLTYNHLGKLTLNSIKFYGKEGSDLMPPVKFAYKKNPNYHKDKYDEWGFYKEDFDVNLINSNRLVTPSSSMATDAWSLSEIQTSIGGTIKVAYEPNDFSKSIYNDFVALAIDKIERLTSSQLKISFKQKGLDLTQFFSQGQLIDLNTMIVNYHPPINNAPPLLPIVDPKLTMEDFDNSDAQVVSINGDEIVILSTTLYESLNPDKTKTINQIVRDAFPYFITGFIKVSDNLKLAGGIRVKSVSILSLGELSSTDYEYKVPGSNLSSGVTSYKPFNMPSIIFPTDIPVFETLMTDVNSKADRKKLIEFKTSFQKHINGSFSKILDFGREAPAPGAIYEYVKVVSKFNGAVVPNYEVHNFQPFEEEMISKVQSDYGTPTAMRRNIAIQNKAVNVGSIKKIDYYHQSGSLLKTIQYGYLNDDDIRQFENAMLAKKQGNIDQSFQKYISLKEYDVTGTSPPQNVTLLNSTDKVVVTTRKDFSNVLTSIRNFDYKSGISEETLTYDFDFYSGQPIKVVSTDSYGNRYMTVSTPAYEIDEYSGMTSTQISMQSHGMGLKLKNRRNKHMLTQQASSTIYKVDVNDAPIGLTSASIQTWSNQIPIIGESLTDLIWKKRSSYSFVGADGISLNQDGLFPFQQFSPFTDWLEISAPTQWLKMESIKKYNDNSIPIEAMDMNGDYAATKMSLDQTKTFATVANASYNEFAFSGAEESASPNGFYGGNVQKLGGAEVSRVNDSDNLTTHTGTKALNAQNIGDRVFGFNASANKDRVYHVSVWTSNPSAVIKYKVNNVTGSVLSSTSIARKAGEWYLVSLDIPASTVDYSLEVWCESSATNTRFDDFRIHPHDAAMISYVYNKWGELSHILDNSNLYTEYIYDGMGRLKEVHRESFQYGRTKTSETAYHYALQND